MFTLVTRQKLFKLDQCCFLKRTVLRSEMEFSACDMQSLANLLKTEEPESDSEDDLKPDGTMGSLAPGDIGPKAKPQNKASSSQKNLSKDIWDAEEVVEGSEYDCLHDPRPQPGYEIIYKQAVTSEDMFLQMGNKTPATASCEDMIVKIHLPETKMSDVELDVKEKFLDLRTPKYFLGLYLPHPVDHKKGKAQWDSRSQTLHVTLHMVRDLDLFNF